jgi:hypothetical protein
LRVGRGANNPAPVKNEMFKDLKKYTGQIEGVDPRIDDNFKGG